MDMWSHPNRSSHRNIYYALVSFVMILLVAGLLHLKFANKKITNEPDQSIAGLIFTNAVSEQEKSLLTPALEQTLQSQTGDVTVDARFSLELPSEALLDVYVPVTHRHTARQTISFDELKLGTLMLLDTTDSAIEGSLKQYLSLSDQSIVHIQNFSELEEGAVAVIPLAKLNPQVKLLAIDGAYYLESLSAGALFRRATFQVEGQEKNFSLSLPEQFTKESILSIRQTGVTALTRVMMTKLAQNNDPLYFSEKIADFLAASDVTHVSNEVSFKDGCAVNYSVFCSDPRFIETLKASGVDVVELTGNHNNDVGSEYNTKTINLYHELGWATFGGGLTSDEARKPFIVEQKDSKVALLGYNYADSPGSGAIAKDDQAGANTYDKAQVAEDIKQARESADFVIVDVQYWECYSYPDGYIEFPVCDKPIGEQRSVFREIIDMGADMVVGTQAHQPQTFEWYNDKPIYYGLGNLYFDQTQWPGTERGIILTHYFTAGKLLQTQLSPTRFDKDLQTRLLEDDEATSLLERLHQAR